MHVGSNRQANFHSRRFITIMKIMIMITKMILRDLILTTALSSHSPHRLTLPAPQKKEKKRFGYTFKKNAEADSADLQLYEPVERVPPFSRKTLVRGNMPPSAMTGGSSRC
jgi:hypothetical protein